MPDVRISALPEATLPLTGTEGIPVVQGGATRRAPSSAFQGPQGIQGIPGDQGIQGIQGIQGEQGTQGTAGFSAYQLAVNGGFAGTEAAWLASLEGPQGIQGIQGIAGADGTQGLQGIQGETGPAGPGLTVGTALPTSGTINLDLAALTDTVQAITLTGDPTFTTSNRAGGRRLELRLGAGGATRTPVWPAGWVAFGAALPASIASGIVLRVTIECLGTADADIDATSVVSV